MTTQTSIITAGSWHSPSGIAAATPTVLQYFKQAPGSPIQATDPSRSYEVDASQFIEHLRRLFAYDDRANREVLIALQASAAPPTRSVRLLAHILSAKKLWLQRIQDQAQTLPV